MTALAPAPAGVYRVTWVPGTDRLLGTCHCGATRQADGPVEIWTWLLAHPDHDGGDRDDGDDDRA